MQLDHVFAGKGTRAGKPGHHGLVEHPTFSIEEIGAPQDPRRRKGSLRPAQGPGRRAIDVTAVCTSTTAGQERHERSARSGTRDADHGHARAATAGREGEYGIRSTHVAISLPPSGHG